MEKQLFFTGNRSAEPEELEEIKKQVDELETYGMSVKEIQTTKEASTKFICDLTKGREIATVRLAIQSLGYDLNAHRINGNIDGWEISKRTQKGTGWK